MSDQPAWQVLQPDLLREFVTEDFQTRVVGPVAGALEQLRNFALDNILMTDSPAVTVRVRTLHLLLDSATEKLSPPERANWLYATGQRIGRDFGNDLLEFLYTAHLLPLSGPAALGAWATLDAGANWGSFVPREDGEKTVVRFEKNFLDALSPDTHRYCTLIAGYIHGIAWVLARAWPRMRHHAGDGQGQSGAPLVPDAVREREGTWPCEFEITWKPEQLPQASDRFFELLQARRLDDRENYAPKMRLIAELALKEKLGIPVEEMLHVPAMLSAAKQKRSLADSGLPFDGIRRMTEICNKAVHGHPVHLSDDEVSDFVHLLDTTLLSLESAVPLGEGAKHEIAENAKIREAGHKPTFAFGDVGSGATVVVASQNVAAASSFGEAELTINYNELETEVRRHLARLERALMGAPGTPEVDEALKLTREVQAAKRWDPGWLTEKLTVISGLCGGGVAAAEILDKLWGLLGTLT